MKNEVENLKKTDRENHEDVEKKQAGAFPSSRGTSPDFLTYKSLLM